MPTAVENTDFLSELNEAQREAVTYINGHSLIIAGAGSGKTRVLTYKVAWLLRQGVLPWEILALTFTNKAAREMNERIATLVTGADFRYLYSGTFHSVFARMLRHEADCLGFSHDFTIYDQMDQRSFLKILIREKGLDEKVYKPKNVADRISEAKNRLMLPDAYRRDHDIVSRDQAHDMGLMGELYEIYMERMRAANAMDFDDLLLYTYLLLLRNEKFRERCQGKFRHILVDEYQDTNYAQCRIVSLLAGEQTSVCVVGDDAQSIYSFRGADISNILHFTNEYSQARLFKLEQNYRSTQTIVSAANDIIRKNQHQIPKTVVSMQDKGAPLLLFDAQKDKMEAERVALVISFLHRNKNIGYNDMAVLYRTNAQSRVFEEFFRSAKVPYRIWGGQSFYQRKEIKDVIAYLRLATNTHDDEAFRRIVNYPARGIGDTTLQRVQEAAYTQGLSLFAVAEHPDTCCTAHLSSATMGRLTNFCQTINRISEAIVQKSAYEAACTAVQESGIARELQAENDAEAQSRKENVDELLSAIKAFEAQQNEGIPSDLQQRAGLTEYLANVSLLTDADEQDDGTPRVTLMTVHAAKGLEYDTVFIVGLEEGLFPSMGAVTQREREEERRLFYVALTRAKKHCILSYARSRFRFGVYDYPDRSSFIDELGEQYLYNQENRLRLDLYSWGSSRQPAEKDRRGLPPGFFRPQRAATQIRLERNAPAPVVSTPPKGFPEPGGRVRHERFGLGTVLEYQDTGASQRMHVRFDEAGEKTLLIKFATFLPV